MLYALAICFIHPDGRYFLLCVQMESKRRVTVGQPLHHVRTSHDLLVPPADLYRIGKMKKKRFSRTAIRPGHRHIVIDDYNQDEHRLMSALCHLLLRILYKQLCVRWRVQVSHHGGGRPTVLFTRLLKGKALTSTHECPIDTSDKSAVFREAVPFRCGYQKVDGMLS